MENLRITKLAYRQKIFLFVVLWISYGGYYYVVNRLDGTHIGFLELSVSIPVFALIAHGVYGMAKTFFARRKYALGGVLLAGFYVGIVVLVNLLVNLLNRHVEIPLNEGQHIRMDDLGFLRHVVVMIGNYTLFGLAYFFMDTAVKNARARQAEAEKRMEEMALRLRAEEERSQYEYLALAGQVSPHFTANLINGWLVQLGDVHRYVALAMERAYELMVYYMDAHLPHKQQVPLSEEMRQLQSFISLLSAKGDDTHIQYTQDGNPAGYALPPTTLLTIAENALKYGRTDLPAQPIHLCLQVGGGVLRFACTNVVKDHHDRVSHGIGLANLKRRLQLAYPDRFRFHANRRKDVHHVNLHIDYG